MHTRKPLVIALLVCVNSAVLFAGCAAVAHARFLSRTVRYQAKLLNGTIPIAEAAPISVPDLLTFTSKVSGHNLSFSYPNEWDVQEIDSEVTVVSSPFTFSSQHVDPDTGTTKSFQSTGTLNMTVSYDQDYTDGRLVAKESDRLTLAKPGLNGMQNPYLSYFGNSSFPRTANTIELTGSKSYASGGIIADSVEPDADIAKHDAHLLINFQESYRPGQQGPAYANVPVADLATIPSFKQALAVIASMHSF